MEQAKKNVKTATNTVEIEGYLKENTLERKTETNKEHMPREVISGSLTLALSAEEEYRMRFYTARYSANGSENKLFTALEKILPDKTTSIATILKNNPAATFESASTIATKMWMRGQFELYDRINDKKDLVSSVTVKGMNAGVKTEASKTPFTLKATFEIDGYIEAVRDEKNKGEETGRVIATLILPDYYNKVCYPIDFICASQSAIAGIRTYERGQSGYFVGNLVNTRKEEVEKRATIKFMDGTEQNNDKKVYTFVNERIIEKMTYPHEEGSKDYIEPADVKEMKVNREVKLTQLDQNSPKPTSVKAEEKPERQFLL